MASKAYRKYVLEFAETLKSIFLLNHWDVQIILSDTECEESSSAAGEVRVDSEYTRAFITLYPAVEEDFNEGHLGVVREYLIHEFVHILEDPIFHHLRPHISEANRDTYVRTLEQQTQHFMRIIHGLLPKSSFPKIK
jgi:hypothetical protein